MTFISPIPVKTMMRRSLTGALATDPILADRPRRVRRLARARRAPDRPRVVRTPAPQS